MGAPQNLGKARRRNQSAQGRVRSCPQLEDWAWWYKKYIDLVLLNQQEAFLQKSEIDGVLNQAFPKVQETLEMCTERL